MNPSAENPHPGGHLTRANGRVRLPDGSDAALSVSSILRLDAADGAGQPSSTDLNEPVLSFGVALANALAESGSPPARLQIYATLWASSTRESAITRTELSVSGQVSGLAQSTLEEVAWRVARGDVGRPSPFGASQVSVTAVVTEPLRPRAAQDAHLPSGSATPTAEDTRSAAESGSLPATVDPLSPGEERDGGSSPARAVSPPAALPERVRRPRRQWIVWLGLAAVLLVLVYLVLRAQQGGTGAALSPGYSLMLAAVPERANPQ